MNKEEGKLLTGKKTIKSILQRLATKDKVRLITNGKNGTTALFNNTTLFADTTGTIGISSTGAGDAFGSGFLSGIIKTNDIKYALAVGTLNAEAVIQKIGAKNGLLKTWPTKKNIKRIKITEFK
jgi:fructokinase